jgi:hypothetical protein
LFSIGTINLRQFYLWKLQMQGSWI